ncbi:MAG: flagellin [Pseudomonadota bacterium]
MAIQSTRLGSNQISLTVQRYVARTEQTVLKTLGRLSSGLRTMSASDDAAGLAISERLRARVRGVAQAQRNANDGVSLLQTADGSLAEIADMLVRMRELAVEAANGTLGTSDRAPLNDEFVALRSEVDRIANVTEYNNLHLLDGSLSSGVTMHVGVDNSAYDRITISVGSARATAIGLSGGMTLSTVTGAQNALALIDSAIDDVSSDRGDVGAYENRLYASINNLATMYENYSAARSRIADADIAQETAIFARTQILMQAGVSMLSQANQLPAMALMLIEKAT